ncbi:hypothetical protein [Candidatus Flexifilum breve]|uniref:hypothetical protein n=1 Tax=Candidatus Flexifilum breve TaxID=3140694 RepID=UPI0031CC5F07
MHLQPTDLPKIGALTTRALNGAGYTRLEQLTLATEAELWRCTVSPAGRCAS